jgi:hypothetical protein
VAAAAVVAVDNRDSIQWRQWQECLMTVAAWQHLTAAIDYRWIVVLDGPLLDSTSDYGKFNILFLLFLYPLQFLCVGIV